MGAARSLLPVLNPPRAITEHWRTIRQWHDFTPVAPLHVLARRANKQKHIVNRWGLTMCFFV
jgi:hypothetical protein